MRGFEVIFCAIDAGGVDFGQSMEKLGGDGIRSNYCLRRSIDS